ncbi:MAG: hypothetical protein Tsb0013_00880 [Phycisphaerales bacterium]
MKNGTKALFGGALMAAGMTANAQTFTYNAYSFDGAFPSFAVSDAYSFGPNADVAYTGVDGLLNTSASNYNALTGTSNASTTQDAYSMRAQVGWAGDGSLGYGFAYARFQQFFTVSEDATVTITWDATGTDNYFSALIFADNSNGNLVASADARVDGTTGSITFFADDDINYVFIGGAIAGGSGPFITAPTSRDEPFLELSISEVPTPGAMALLSVAGLAGIRRRR